MLDTDLRRASGPDFAKEIRGFHGRRIRGLLHVGRAMMPAFRPALEIASPIFGAGAVVWRRLPSGAIKGSLLAVAARLTRALMRRTALGVLTVSIVVAFAIVGEAFAAEVMMAETVMLGVLVGEAFVAKTVMPEAMMFGTLAVGAFAAKAVMAETVMLGTLTIETFAAKFLVTEAVMPRFFAIEAVMMFEAVMREALLLRTAVFTVMPGEALMIELLVTGALLFFALLFGGVVFALMPGASLRVALMARVLLGALGKLETVHGGCQDVFADLYGDLFFLRLADHCEDR